MINIIVAHDRNKGIGKNNQIPWDIPEDMKRFKRLTSGHPVVMGRKTYESILDHLGKPLPARTNIVITRNPSFETKHDDVIISLSFNEALEKAQDIHEDIFVIGGASVYHLALPFADRLYATVIHKNFDCDRFFPEYRSFGKKVERIDKEHEDLNYSFITLHKEK